ncbi:MAG: TatD DNase family protein [Methyloprofundus sp.]|nr:MAG: TatD DNase family protein [Methyloprofundus sp.]
MLIDSHCHLDKLDLAPYQNDFSCFMREADKQNIEHMLCISIDLEAYPSMCELVRPYDNISLSVGVHPNVDIGQDPTAAELIALADNERVVAIGETGLDYFRSEGDLAWQHQRFVNHIEAAKVTKKPLIIHTREASVDTLRILKEQGADEVGGVIHCFTEDWDFAQQAMALNFYISFSGIVTFKNAKAIQEVAKKVPADRYLIETDSPYLAPTPFRGKSNYPIYVQHVAQYVADLREVSVETVAQQSNDNFRRLFSVAA